MINKQLATYRGISQEDQDRIEELHILVENLTEAAISERYPNVEEVVELIHQAEEQLQLIWGSDVDRSKHHYADDYEFRAKWAGKTFKCTISGETITIPDDVRQCELFGIGDGFLDVGRHNHYSRMSDNIVEVLD